MIHQEKLLSLPKIYKIYFDKPMQKRQEFASRRLNFPKPKHQTCDSHEKRNIIVAIVHYCIKRALLNCTNMFYGRSANFCSFSQLLHSSSHIFHKFLAGFCFRQFFPLISFLTLQLLWTHSTVRISQVASQCLFHFIESFKSHCSHLTVLKLTISDL